MNVNQQEISELRAPTCCYGYFYMFERAISECLLSHLQTENKKF